MANQLISFSSRGKSNMRLFVDLPQRPEQLAGVRGQRSHNRFVKTAMRAALQYHHTNHIPLHFRLNARNIYGYMERKAPYKKAKLKKHRSIRDLVYSGATEKAWTTGQGYKALRVGGQADEAAGKPLTGTLVYQWSWTERVRQHMAKKFESIKFNANASDTEKSAKRIIRRQMQGALDRVRAKAGVTIAQMTREASIMIPAERTKVADVLFNEYWKQVEGLKPPRKRVGKAA